MSSNPPSWQQTAPGTSSSSAQPGATSATAQAPAQTNQQNIAAQDRLWSSKPLISQSPYLKNLTSVTNGSVPTPFTGYSAATEEILRRVRENGSAKVGMPGWEAAREQVLKNMATSDKILTPPLNSLNKRARGGVKARSGLQPGITGTDSISRGTTSIGSAGSPTESATAGASMGSARGRGRARGKGRNAGRSGKRKRDSDDEAIDLDEDEDEDADSDISASYTPQTTITKSGRNVNKPAQYTPVVASPSVPKRKRSYKRNPEASVCKVCHRGHSPGNNMIVFCDSCNTPYHQYCHDPPIEKEFVEVETKEWLCAMCERAKHSAIKDTEGLVAAEGLSVEEKRAYFRTLPSTRLVDLLIHATTLQPALPLFPLDARALIPSNPSGQRAPEPPILSQSAERADENGLGVIDSTVPDTSPGDDEGDAYVDAFDSDPPAHYPKPGNGLARTIRPEAEQIDWLVDYNNEVFEHVVYRDGDGDDVQVSHGFPGVPLSNTTDGNGQATVV